MAFTTFKAKSLATRTSLEIQWLRPELPLQGGTDSIPGWGTKILHGAECGQKQRRMVEITVYSYCIVPEMLKV